MLSRAKPFASALLMNLAAVYLPALCWLPVLTPKGWLARKVAGPWLFALWPVLAIDPTETAEVLTGALVFVAVLAGLSLWVRHRRRARLVVLGLLCLASFLEGLGLWLAWQPSPWRGG